MSVVSYTEEPTMALRWFKDDPLEKPRLQQSWIVTRRILDNVPVESNIEWRDVPTEYGG